MSESKETSTEGPASLREALTEAFAEANQSDEIATAPESTDTEPTDDEPQLDASIEAEADESDSEDESQSEPEVIPAPEHWSDEDKAMFDELPVAARDYLLKREKQYEQGIEGKAEQIKPIEEAFGPYDEILKLRGVDRATAIRSWVAAQQALDSDPVTGFKMLIDSYGPDIADKIRNSVIGQPTDDDDDYTDPEIRKIKEDLRRQKQQMEQAQAQFDNTRTQDAMTQIQRFKDAVDDKGELLHPLFDKARPTMQALLTSGVATDLESAYSQAVKTLPEYEQEIAAKLKAEAEKAEAEKREQAAKRAKRTAKTVNGKSSKPPPQAKPATLRDDLLEAWDQSLRGELNG